MPMTLERNLWLTTPMMRGDDVLVVQQRLAELGETLDRDGLYGRGTRTSIVKFQRAQGLQSDGVVGIATWTRLMAPGAGAPVVEAQRQADEVIDLVALRQPHRQYQDGCEWALGPDGVMVRSGGPSLLPSDAERKLVRQVFATYQQEMTTVLREIQVPAELVVATICTESSGKPRALRFEPGCDRLVPARTPSRVSAGLTQTLLSTAREALDRPGLTLDDLYTPEISIQAGAAYMWNQGRRTGFDPPLVAAAYNAGSLRRNDGAANHWKLTQYPIDTAQHVDNFCRFFNAAMQDDSKLAASVPRLRDMLASGGAFSALAPVVGTAKAPAARAAPAWAAERDPNALNAPQIEAELKKAGLYAGADGDPAALHTAVRACFDREAKGGTLAQGWESWSDARIALAVEQALLRDAGEEVGKIDGLLGPQTMFAREAFQVLRTTGKKLVQPERDAALAAPELLDGPATAWPRQSECDRFYGKPGEHLVSLELPYPMRLAWDTGLVIRRFQCHEKVRDAFLRVFQEVLSEYGEQRICELRLDLFGGCFNIRKMRGGNSLSMHSWGIAIDLDPMRNQLRMTRRDAAFAQLVYEPFWKIVESEGLVSLGRMRDFDWMHFQAARF
ncbi:peptidoglycan-binding protein [Falsiroseomonas sp. E2-1-a20]|uniref:peptidoglycan-binding protein n=1 Tax=Falsiroseomonas sp. E2-1-a20 TaxID=3239300 RepID=UPI003F3969AE